MWAEMAFGKKKWQTLSPCIVIFVMLLRSYRQQYKPTTAHFMVNKSRLSYDLQAESLSVKQSPLYKENISKKHITHDPTMMKNNSVCIEEQEVILPLLTWNEALVIFFLCGIKKATQSPTALQHCVQEILLQNPVDAYKTSVLSSPNGWFEKLISSQPVGQLACCFSDVAV